MRAALDAVIHLSCQSLYASCASTLSPYSSTRIRRILHSTSSSSSAAAAEQHSYSSTYDLWQSMNTAAAAGSAGEMHSDSLPSIGPYFYYSFCYDPSNSCALGILVFLELASIIRPLYMYMFLLQLASSICYLFVLPPPSTPINLFMYFSLFCLWL